MRKTGKNPSQGRIAKTNRQLWSGQNSVLIKNSPVALLLKNETEKCMRWWWWRVEMTEWRIIIFSENYGGRKIEESWYFVFWAINNPWNRVETPALHLNFSLSFCKFFSGPMFKDAVLSEYRKFRFSTPSICQFLPKQYHLSSTHVQYVTMCVF